MEDHRRTRSQGLPSLSEGAELIQWDSLQDLVRIEREHAEARRLAREANTVININKRMVENSEILQVTNTQPRYTVEAPQSGEISPKQQEQEGHVSITPKLGEIPPIQTDEGNLPHLKLKGNFMLVCAPRICRRFFKFVYVVVRVCTGKAYSLLVRGVSRSKILNPFVLAQSGWILYYNNK